ncbi:MAG: hypothetical protein V1929_03770 [bacterium]
MSENDPSEAAGGTAARRPNRTRGSVSLQTAFDVLLILLFAACLTAPMLGVFVGMDLRSGAEDEKRELATFPTWEWKSKTARAFPGKFDAWFQDRFGLRRLLIRGHSLLSFYVLHTSPSPKVIIGKDGWLYYDGLPASDGDPINEYRGNPPLTPYQLERWRWMFEDVSDALHERNIRFLLTLVPAKEQIYPEYMPDYLTPVGESANVQISRYLTERGRFEFLDLRPALLAARQEERLYMRTDTHWNAYGAYVGYRSILGQLAAWYPRLQPWPLSDFELIKTTYLAGDLGQMMDLRRVMHEDAIGLIPLKPRHANVQQQGDRDLADIISETGDTNLPRAVIFRDSFAVDLIPYLSEHFNRAFYKWSRLGIEMKPIEQEKPDIVLHILADRILGRGLRYPTSMQIRASERRFAVSTNILAIVHRVGPLHDASVDLGDNGDIIVHAQGYQPTVELPVIPDAKRYMPIVRMEVSAPARTVATIAWTSRIPSPTRMEINADLARGSNTVYFPLMDPEMTGPLRLNIGTQKGDYTVHAIEVRGFPR